MEFRAEKKTENFLYNFNPLYQEIIQKQSEIEAKAEYGDQGKSRAT